VKHQKNLLISLGILIASIGVGGCTQRDDPVDQLCQNLSIKCEGEKRITFALDRIEEGMQTYLEKSEAITNKVNQLNKKIPSSLVKEVKINRNLYVNLGINAKNKITQSDIQGLPVYSENLLLIRNQDLFFSSFQWDMSRSDSGFLTSAPMIREKGPGYEKFKLIQAFCRDIKIAECRITFKGKLDAVWIREQVKDVWLDMLKGRLEFEDVALHKFEDSDLRSAIKASAFNKVKQTIRQSGKNMSAITWDQIYEVVRSEIALLE
jgi:hypothetical protein